MHPTQISEAKAQVPLVATTTPVHAGTVRPTEYIDSLIKGDAKTYGVSYTVMYNVIKCESHFDPTIQSQYHYTWSDPSIGVYKGDQEQSYGLVMIHLPAHPDITKDQAEDPEFAVSYLAQALAKGEGNQWTCYRNIYG